MAVFPENMDKLSADDVPGSLSIIENYIRYMGERMEFAMRNMTKTVSAAGVSSAEMYILLTALQNTVSAVSSTISDVFLMGGGVNIDSGFVVGVAGFISDVLSSVAGLSTPELTRSALLKV